MKIESDKSVNQSGMLYLKKVRRLCNTIRNGVSNNYAPKTLSEAFMELNNQNSSSYFVIILSDKEIFFDEGKNFYIKRVINDDVIIFKDFWLEYERDVITHINEATGISEDDYNNVANHETNVLDYIEHQKKQGNCYYLRFGAEDGVGFFEFRNESILRSVVHDAWDGVYELRVFDDSCYQWIINGVIKNRGASNIISKDDFETLLKKVKKHGVHRFFLPLHKKREK